MAKKMKKLMSMALVLCMMASMLSVGAFAADGTVVETESSTVDGITTNVTTTTTTTTDENGNVTVNLKIESNSAGVNGAGETVTGNEVYEETTVTDSEGDEVSSEWEVNGSEAKEWEEEVTPETEVPDVTVVVKPGETVTETEIDTVVKTEGDVQDGEDDTEYDYTETTTTINRDVTVEAGDVEVEASVDREVSLEGVIPENYEGKVNITPDSYGPWNSKYFDKISVVDEEGNSSFAWVARFNRTDDEMSEELKDLYTYNEETQLWVPNAVSGKTTFTDAAQWEFIFAERGEYSQSGQAVIYDRYNDNGHFVLYDQDGNRFYSYCMDAKIGTATGYKYVLENLEDADYFKGTEEEQEEAKAHIRAIALNGYWGNEEGTGSFANLQQGLIDALNNGLEIKIAFTDGSGSYNFDSSTPEGLALLLDMAENINEGEALAATQGAIWSFGRDGNAFQGFNPKRANAPDASKDENGKWVYEHGGPEARMELIYRYLRSLTAEQNETTIIDQNNFLTEDGVQLTVGSQVEGDAANYDENKDNDVYNTELTFTMVVEPSTEKGDDLVVTLYDANGNVIRKARLAGDDSNDDKSIFSKLRKNGSSYTFENLQLSENNDFVFDLRLEGIQNLEEGVYIYKHVNGYEAGQTLVGLAKGETEVNVGAKFSLSFDVKEDQTISVKRVWHDEADPEVAPNPGVFALAVHRPLENIPEEEVPLADAPQTGDEAIVFAALTLLAGISLMAMHVSEQKRKEEV